MAEVHQSQGYPYNVLRADPRHVKGCTLWRIPVEFASCACGRDRPEPTEWR